MKPGDELPEGSTVLRTAKARDAVAEPPTPAFLLRREIAEKDLSVQWLEFFSDAADPKDQLRQACHAVGAKPNRSGSVLFVNTNGARAKLLEHRLDGVRIVYTPDIDKAKDRSHSSVVGIDVLDEPSQLTAAVSLAISVTRREKWGDLVDQKIAPKT
jgi:hypothetical protein